MVAPGEDVALVAPGEVVALVVPGEGTGFVVVVVVGSPPVVLSVATSALQKVRVGVRRRGYCASGPVLWPHSTGLTT